MKNTEDVFLSKLFFGCKFDSNLLNFIDMLTNIYLTLTLIHSKLFISAKFKAELFNMS